MSDVGATLRDASSPSDIFFHHAGRTLVEVPPSFSGWSPHGEGFVLGKRREVSLFETFDALISGHCLDLQKLAQIAIQLYGREIAPQVLGRRLLALVPEK